MAIIMAMAMASMANNVSISMCNNQYVMWKWLMNNNG